MKPVDQNALATTAVLMQMPLRQKTFPVMAGEGRYGSLDRGCMVNVAKVRNNINQDDFDDPVPYKHHQERSPASTRPRCWDDPCTGASDHAHTLQVRKPSGHEVH